MHAAALVFLFVVASHIPIERHSYQRPTRRDVACLLESERRRGGGTGRPEAEGWGIEEERWRRAAHCTLSPALVSIHDFETWSSSYAMYVVVPKKRS